MSNVVLFCLCSWSLVGVFATECVSVTEGDSVSLSVNLTEEQRGNTILWSFGPKEVTIAEMNVKESTTTLLDKERADGRFRDRLKLDIQSVSLIITHIRITDSGPYYITTSGQEKPLKRFNMTVYGRLPVPVISRDSSQCSSSSSVSNCSVLCSVMNVSHVSVSWYKGKSLLSNISVSDLNIRLSLPLEVEYQDTNTYICVINNPIANKSQHLDINHVCQPCSDKISYIIGLSCLAGFLILVAALLMLCICGKRRKTNQEDQSGEQDITYADPTFYKTRANKPRCAVEDDVVYAGVMRR